MFSSVELLSYPFLRTLFTLFFLKEMILVIFSDMFSYLKEPHQLPVAVITQWYSLNQVRAKQSFWFLGVNYYGTYHLFKCPI